MIALTLATDGSGDSSKSSRHVQCYSSNSTIPTTHFAVFSLSDIEARRMRLLFRAIDFAYRTR